jgi:hypothetical protein
MAPSVLKGPARAYRMWKEEGLRDRAGKVIVDFDASKPEHIQELIGMAMGFQPTRIARAYEGQFAEKEQRQYYNELRGVIRTDLFYGLDEARRTGDRTIELEARAAIQQYNKEAPLGMEFGNWGQAYQEHVKQIIRHDMGLGQSNKEVPMLRDIQSGFPAATEERIK